MGSLRDVSVKQEMRGLLMTFSIFANVLKPIIGGSDNTVEFTRKLFIAMIGEDKSKVIEPKITRTAEILLFFIFCSSLSTIGFNEHAIT